MNLKPGAIDHLLNLNVAWFGKPKEKIVFNCEISSQCCRQYFYFIFQDSLVEAAKEEANSISNIISQAAK